MANYYYKTPVLVEEVVFSEKAKEDVDKKIPAMAFGQPIKKDVDGYFVLLPLNYESTRVNEGQFVLTFTNGRHEVLSPEQFDEFVIKGQRES
jgi:hypothetical protein